MRLKGSGASPRPARLAVARRITALDSGERVPVLNFRDDGRLDREPWCRAGRPGTGSGPANSPAAKAEHFFLEHRPDVRGIGHR